MPDEGKENPKYGLGDLIGPTAQATREQVSQSKDARQAQQFHEAILGVQSGGRGVRDDDDAFEGDAPLEDPEGTRSYQLKKKIGVRLLPLLTIAA